jgi:hypothetical protein
VSAAPLGRCPRCGTPIYEVCNDGPQGAFYTWRCACGDVPDRFTWSAGDVDVIFTGPAAPGTEEGTS